MVHPEKEAFFETMKAQHLALTYDDVRVQSRSGRGIEPEPIDITSHFSKNVELKAPFVSAAMDTVTEKDMAIEIAKLGGIGVIHAAMDAEDQRRQVRTVKFHLNGLIPKPFTVREDETVEQVINQHGHRNFHTFPVVDSENRCVGVMTGRDFEFYDGHGTVAENMTSNGNLLTVPQGTSIKQAYDIMLEKKVNTLPVVDEDMQVRGLYLWSDVKRIIRDNSGMFNVDQNGRLVVAAAIPTDDSGLERVQEMKKYVDVFVLDSADGDSYYAFKYLEKVKQEAPDVDVVVGNISNSNSAKELAEAGADGVKVGQGPGSICTTRREIGIGRPQVTAVYECAKALRDSNIPVCADGGIRYPGDIPIAIAAGANSVMMGSMLAGTNEAPGEIILQHDGSRGKKYRGMGSASALRESAAARQRYGDNGDMPLPEGVESTVNLKGPASDVLRDCTKALIKQMKYAKTYSIKQHQQEALLDRITNAGLNESHPHSVNVIR